MVGDVGVTAIETRVAAVTVREVDPVMEPEVAVIVVVPTPAPDTRPCVPELLLIVATLGLDELQVTESVKVCMLPSEYVPVAMNC